MKTVGQILKEERLRKNISLEEVEIATKIRRKTLLSLENSDWKNLPSTTFVKGLIKNYGKFLGLDHTELIAFFRREFDEKREVKKIINTNKVKQTGFRLTPALLTIGVVAVASIAVLTYLFVQYRSFTGPPLLELSEPKDNIKVNTPEVSLVGKTWDDAKLKINGQEVQVSPGGSFSLSIGLNPGINVITVTAENRFGKISTQKRTVVVDLEDKPQTVILEETPVVLTIKISPDSTSLLVEIDGRKEFDGIMVAGTEKTFSAKDRIRIVTKNAGSTKVLFNNIEESLGNSGEEAEKTYQKTPSQ